MFFFFSLFFFVGSLPVQETTQETLKRFWKAIQAFVSGSTPLCGGSRKEVKNAEITARAEQNNASARRRAAAFTGCRSEDQQPTGGVAAVCTRTAVKSEPSKRCQTHHVGSSVRRARIDENQSYSLLLFFFFSFLLHFHADPRQASRQSGRQRGWKEGSRLACLQP